MTHNWVFNYLHIFNNSSHLPIPINPFCFTLPLYSISQCHKSILAASFIDSKIQTTVWKLGPWKVSGPDGLLIAFYKEHWNSLGKDFINIIQHILSSQLPLGTSNYTNLILLLKSNRYSSPSDFRPIVLCNAICKVVSKIFSERLTKILPYLIPYNK